MKSGRDDRAAVRAFVRSEREQRPSDASMSRMAARLAVEPSAPAAPPPAERRPAYYKIGFLAVLAMGGVGAGWRAGHRPSPAAPAISSVSPVSSVSSGPTLEAAPSAHSPIVFAPEPSPVLSVDDLPAAAAPPRAVTIAKNARAAGPASAATPVSELELVRRARTSLDADPASALATTAEHARLFPSGEFVQEREVIAVEALARLGRKEEALRRARALLEQFPSTPYATRLEKAAGQPLSR